MRAISQAFKDNIGSHAQHWEAKLVVLAANRATILDEVAITSAISVRLSIQQKQKVRRSLTIDLDNKDDAWTPALNKLLESSFWLDKWIRYVVGPSTADMITIFEGRVDQGRLTVDPKGNVLRVEALDGMRRAMTHFGEVVTYTHSPSKSLNYARAAQGATISATSQINIGDQIQGAASVSYKGFVLFGGVRVPVNNELADSVRNIVDHTRDTVHRFQYTHPNATAIEVEYMIDLGRTESVQSISIAYTGSGYKDFYTSTDGISWSPYAAGASYRYIKFTVYSNTYTVTTEGRQFVTQVNEVEILAGAACPAANAIDGNEFTAWRPAVTDSGATITVGFNADRTIHQVLLKWSTDDKDLWNRVRYRVETSPDGVTWTVRTNLSNTQAGFVEHAYPSGITCRYLRLVLTGMSGMVILRDITVYGITATLTYSYLARQIASHFGETTKLSVTDTMFYWPVSTIGWAEDDEHAEAVVKLAEALGWDTPYYSADGYFTLAPVYVNPCEPAWEYTEENALLTSFSLDYTLPKNFTNKVKLVGLSSNWNPIAVVVADDRLNSPTSTLNVGTVFTKKFSFAADTVEKVAAGANEMLRRGTQLTLPGRLQAPANPALDIHDTVRVRVGNIDEVFEVVGIDLTMDSKGFTMSLDLALIPR